MVIWLRIIESAMYCYKILSVPLYVKIAHIDCRLLLSFSVGACLMSSDQYAMKSVDVLSSLTNQKNPFIFNKKNINVQKCFFDRLN
jgi:hypothetical protein